MRRSSDNVDTGFLRAIVQHSAAPVHTDLSSLAMPAHPAQLSSIQPCPVHSWAKQSWDLQVILPDAST